MTYRAFAIAFTLAIICVILSASPSYARAITVTSLADDGSAGTLRAAINQANSDANGDTITFQSGLTGAITLTSGLPSITTSMTIQGPGESILAVDGAKMYRPFDISAPGGSITLSGLMIQNGSDQADTFGGGGIYVMEGDLTLRSCILSGNHAYFEGGAIDNFIGSVIAVTDCVLTTNTADARSFRSGGGIGNLGTATIIGTTLLGNSAAYGGGLDNNGNAVLADSALSGNVGEGIYNTGTATIGNCTLSGNAGSGIDNGPGASITLSNCKLSANVCASLGGGMQNDGTAALTNCELSGNVALAGGAIDGVGGTLNLSNCTVSGNKALSRAAVLIFMGLVTLLRQGCRIPHCLETSHTLTVAQSMTTQPILRSPTARLQEIQRNFKAVGCRSHWRRQAFQTGILYGDQAYLVNEVYSYNDIAALAGTISVTDCDIQERNWRDWCDRPWR